MARQSCLEKRSITARHEQIVRNDYSAENIYDENHPDARATGDQWGKGTGDNDDLTYEKPDFIPGMNHIISYKKLNTDPKSHAGNNVDNNYREKMTIRNTYSIDKQYCPEGVAPYSDFDISEIQFIQ